MRIAVHVKPKAREDMVVRIDERHFRVSVTEVPESGKANDAVIALLAAFFHVPKTSLKLISGAATRYKIIDIPETSTTK